MSEQILLPSHTETDSRKDRVALPPEQAVHDALDSDETLAGLREAKNADYFKRQQGIGKQIVEQGLAEADR